MMKLLIRNIMDSKRKRMKLITLPKNQDRKTILYIGNFFFPTGNAAGKRVYANGKILKELGYEVIFIGMNKKINASVTLKDTKCVYDGFTFYNFFYPSSPIEWLRFKKDFKMLVAFLDEEKLIDRLKFIIYYGVPRLSIFLSLLIRYCRRKNIKIVSDCVDWLTTKTGHYLFDLVKWLNDRYVLLYANRKADGIITISSYLASYYEKRGCSTVIIPPLSLCENTVSTQEASPREMIITYAGVPFRKGQLVRDRNTLKDRIDKAITLLYEAKKRGCSFQFNVYGLSKEEYLKALPSQKSQLDKLGENIVFYGYRPNKEVMDCIKNSDFTILIRDVKRDTMAGFPTKISESISCGTPVITTKTSDLKYYIIEGKNGFFLDISNKSKAAEALTGILSMDRKQINRMKKYCVESQLFYYRNYRDHMEKFLNKI